MEITNDRDQIEVELRDKIAVLMEDNTNLKRKAEMWDTLSEKISKFYVNAEGEYDEDKPENGGDLTDIGEIAAIAFGWL